MKLFVSKFGKKNLTLYMMKLIDVVPVSLKSLSFKSVTRASTKDKLTLLVDMD